MITCPESVRRDAVLQLAAAQDERYRAKLTAAIKQALERFDPDWSGLLIKPDEQGKPAGAIWVEVLPGKEANLWLPQLAYAGAADLLQAATRWARGQGIRVMKTVLDVDDHPAAALLEANGFPQVVCLHYLGASPQAGVSTPEAGRMTTFTQVGEVTFERFCELFAQVEEGSLDCPELQGIFTAEEALMGFRRQDVHAPAQWYLVRCENEDAGVLLLAPHPAAGNWELMYMGLVPAWRGHGLGRQVVDKTLRLAGEAGVNEVLLAVDERNTPARTLYEQAGFEVRARCVVHAWLMRTSTTSHHGVAKRAEVWVD
ncbi:GNAT family N-acetyltransferase [Halomonas sp. Bachu 37]|uniref:GNAT family N-acetyltransferase n=1 Tax=Halomonas kashgarensis TaxID=3084920 RepID=UPI003217A4A0